MSANPNGVNQSRYFLSSEDVTILPNHKFLDMTTLKAFADDKLNVDKRTISLCDRVESTVGKEENAGYQHFLLFAFQSLLL